MDTADTVNNADIVDTADTVDNANTVETADTVTKKGRHCCN
jgi:hypothetical protein